MSKTKFTPGPWGIGDGPEVYAIEAYRSVAIVCLHQEAEANACLLAAAPELYSALDEAADYLAGLAGCADFIDAAALLVKCTAALAAARGEH